MSQAKTVFQRVTDEHEALWENIDRYQAFRDGKQPDNVNDYQWRLLKKQLRAMRKYNKILSLRVDDLYEDVHGNHDGLNVTMINGGKVKTPGQANTENVDLNAFTLQSDKDFMKDGENILLEHYR